MQAFKSHQSFVQKQRVSFNREIAEVAPGKAVLVMEFKENLKLPMKPIEVNKDFYTKSQVNVLGIALYQRRKMGRPK